MSQRRTVALAALVSLVALGLLALAACGLDIEGTAAAPSNDPDAASDAASSATDGATTPDDGAIILLPPVDGGADAPSGLPGFCAGQSAYVRCWDFDDVPAGGDAGFSGSYSTAVGADVQVVLDGLNPVLEARLPALGASRSVWAYQGISGFNQLGSRYEVEMKVSVRSAPIDYAVLGALWATTAGSQRVFGPSSYSGGTAIDMVAPDTSPNRLAAPAGPTWRLAKITLSGPPMSMRATLVVDGVTLQDETFYAGPQNGTNIDLRLGAYFSSGDAKVLTVLYDDIVVRKMN